MENSVWSAPCSCSWPRENSVGRSGSTVAGKTRMGGCRARQHLRIAGQSVYTTTIPKGGITPHNEARWFHPPKHANTPARDRRRLLDGIGRSTPLGRYAAGSNASRGISPLPRFHFASVIPRAVWASVVVMLSSSRESFRA
jgi:hypothetical protein